MAAASPTLADALSILSATWHEARIGFDFAMSPLVACAESLGTGLSAETLWAGYLRGVSCALAVACVSLAMQVGAMASTKGVWPVQARFDRMRSDYPALARFLYLPSWLYLCHADWMLPTLLAAGAVIGLGLVWSSLASRTGLFVMCSIYLSYANILNLRCASDNLLLEMGFLSLFFPSLDSSAGAWSLVSQPLPILTFSVQCLLARMVIGSATSKFTGTQLTDLSLSPCIPPPLTRLGWLLHQLPHWLQLASSLFLVILEMAASVLIFVSGWPRLLAIVIVLTTQIGSAVTSAASGFQTLLTCVLGLSLLDVNASLLVDLRAVSWDLSISAPGDLAVQVVLGLLLVLHFVHLPLFDSLWFAADGSTSKVAALLHLLSPWRLSHSPAQLSRPMLPPSTSARYLWIPVIEATAAEVIDEPRCCDAAFVAAEKQAGKVLATEASWERYNYKSLPCSEESVPAFTGFNASPSRIEQAILRESLGLGLAQPRCSPLDVADPYSAGLELLPSTQTLTQVCAGLLRGDAAVEDLFSAAPFGARSSGARAVRSIRVSMFLLQPTSLQEMRHTGRWFSAHYSHAIVPPMTLQAVQSGQVGCLRLPEPELFEADAVSALWAHRSGAVQQLLVKVHSTPTQELSSSIAAHDTQELAGIKTVERTRIGSSSVAPILRAHAAAMESSGPAPAFAFRCSTLSESDVQSFWIDVVKPLQPLLKSLHCPPPDLDDIAAPLHPLQNGSRNVGLSDTVLQRARNHGFKTDHPWNLADPGQFSHVMRGVHASSLWTRMDPDKRERHELILARLTLVMMERLRPMYHGPPADEPAHSVWSDREGLTIPSPRLDCIASGSPVSHLHLPSLFHLSRFCHHIIGHGAATYERLLRDPSQAAGMLSCYSIESGMAFTALFQRERLEHWARQRRMMSCVVHPATMEFGGRLPGSLSVYYSFLGTQFKPAAGAGEECFPSMAPLDAPRFFARQWKLDASEMPKQGPGMQSSNVSSSSHNGSGNAVSAKEDPETIAAIGRTSSRVSAGGKKRQ